MAKVLIVEDDLVLARMLEEVLVDGGHEVCGIARTVDVAVALDERHKPDLAILDVRLAAGGLGTDVSARLTRSGRPGILYTTGNSDPSGLTQADGEASLRKPYRPADLVRALKIVEEIVATGEASGPFPEGFQLLQPSSTDDGSTLRDDAAAKDRLLTAMPMPKAASYSCAPTSSLAPQTPRLSTTPAVWNPGHLRIATDAAGVALWSWDVDTDEVALDERAHRLWGIPVADGLVTFESLSARIHPEDLDRVRAAFTSTREVFGAYEIDFRILRDGAVHWVSARGRGDDQGIVGRIMFGVFLDVSGRKIAEEGREMLADEMSHRVKNLFAIAAALTQIAARSAVTPAAMADDVVRRLVALGNAHELVRPSLAHQREAVDLGELLAVLLAAYDDKGVIGDRIHVSVPDVMVGEASITTVALVIHELATNSLKYGALSAASGTLTVDGAALDGEVTIVWTERGGPRVTVARGQDGFGSKLVKGSIVNHLGGSITFDWPSDGAIVTLRISEARMGA